jgi:hypothetical protein
MPRGKSYEEDAKLIDDILVYLGCSACGLMATDLCHFTGYVRNVDATTQLLRDQGLTANKVLNRQKLPPFPVKAIFGAIDKQALFEIHSFIRPDA